MARFDLRYEWLEPPDDDEAFGPERSTWARLVIELDGAPLTRHVSRSRPSPTVAEDGVVGGMSSLADWIVENWLYLSWETHTPFGKVTGDGLRVPTLRDARENAASVTSYSALARWLHRHSLGHGASDLALPSVVFLPEDRQIGVFVAAPSYSLDPSVQFTVQWPRESFWLSKADLLSSLGSMVVATIEKAKSSPDTVVWATWLEKKFASVQASESQEDVRREYQFGSVVASAWNSLAPRLGQDTDVLAGILIDASLVEDPSTLETVARAVESSRKSAKQSETWRQVRTDVGDRMLVPYERGYRLASRARALLANPSAPLMDLRDVLHRFDVDVRPFEGPELFRSACLVSASGGARVLYSEGHPMHTSGVAPTRFAVAAGLGRLLAESSARAPFGAAQGTQSRYERTQEANAFAAEFLLPEAALRQSSDLDALCDDYGISRTAAERHRRNRLHL